LNHGDAMSAWILTDKGRFVHRTLVFPIKEEEWASDGFKERVAEFESRLKERLKDRYNPLEPDPEGDKEVETPTHEPYEPINPNDKPATPELAEADDIQHEAHGGHEFLFQKWVDNEVLNDFNVFIHNCVL